MLSQYFLSEYSGCLERKVFPLIHFGVSVENPGIGLPTPLSHNVPVYFEDISAVVQSFEHSLALPSFGIGMKTDLFQSCGHC